MRFTAFFRGRKAISSEETDLKIVATIGYVPECPRKFSKSEKMGAKFYAHHRPFRSELKIKFYHSLLPHIL